MCVCVFVCVSCLCRPPSHWWISFIFYTIIGLDPEGGQWLFKFKSNHNKKNNRQNAKQYMWDSTNLWSRKHTNLDTVVGFENEMVSHAHARHARHSRVFTPEFGDSLDSRQLLQLRACPHSNVQDTLAYSLQSSVIHSTHVSCFSYVRAHTLMCFVGLFPPNSLAYTAMQLASLGVSRTRQCNLQVRTSEAGQDIFKLSKFVLRGY